MNRTLRVLNIEDSERDVALLTRHLSHAGYDLLSDRVDTPAAMKAALEAQEWDVILCDYSMPHFNALQALEVLKELELDLPFIIISGTVGEAVAVEAMRAGAHDYLMKDNLVRLAPTIERELHEAENRRARRRAEVSLKASEAELRALFAAITDVIFVLDAEGRYLRIAPTDPTYLYEPSAELMGKTLHEVFAEEEADFFLDHIRRALAEGRAHRVEYSLQIGGKEVWFDGSVSPMTKDSVIWIARDITERKQSEEEKARLTAQIESQRQRLNNIVATVPGLVWEAWGEPDVATQRIDFISDYVETMLGYSIEEWLSTPNFWLSIVHPDDRERTAQAAAASFASGQISTLEFRWMTKDGRVIWVESNSAVITDDEGRPAGLRGVTTDISERKRSEEALRESEERYKGLIDSAFDGVVIHQRRVIRSVNRAYAEMFGYTVEELIGQDVLDITPPEHRDSVLSQIRQDESLYETVGLKKDGTHINIEISAKNCLYEGERACLAAARDITERKRAEEQLRRQLDFTGAITASLGEGVYALDPSGRVTFMNPAAEAALGWTQAELLGQQMHEIIHFQKADGTRWPSAECPLLEVLRSGQTVKVESDVFTRRDGSMFSVSYTSSPIITDGQIVGAVLAFRDVTERKALEEQFRQAQKMEAIGQLAGGVAHDFNNLLTVITGYSGLAINGLQTEDPLRRYLEEIRKATDRASSLTRQLLAFSRKQVLQPQALNLNSVVSEMEKMLRRLIGENIELRTVLKPQLGNIKADPGQIEQVIMNLAVNARDAMPRGGQLTIETEEVYLDEEYARQRIAVSPGPHVMLAISDSGTGMDEQTQKRIFDPFFTTKEVGKGTGLGLSTVYGIVKQSGGNIWVYSEVGRGTTFKIYLPRIDEEAQEYKRRTTPTASFQGTETILVVEDEEMVRELTREVLEKCGYQVLEAARGSDALFICERHQEPIHLLLTDVIMPEMSGRELASRLAQLRPEIKVMYMSGYTDDAIVHHGILDSNLPFLQKPYAPSALVRKVREVLDRAR